MIIFFADFLLHCLLLLLLLFLVLIDLFLLFHDCLYFMLKRVGRVILAFVQCVQLNYLCVCVKKLIEFRVCAAFHCLVASLGNALQLDNCIYFVNGSCTENKTHAGRLSSQNLIRIKPKKNTHKKVADMNKLLPCKWRI